MVSILLTPLPGSVSFDAPPPRHYIVLQRHVYTYLIPSAENMAALLVVVVMQLSSSAHRQAALTGPGTNRQRALLGNDGEGESTFHEQTGSLQLAAGMVG